MKEAYFATHTFSFHCWIVHPRCGCRMLALRFNVCENLFFSKDALCTILKPHIVCNFTYEMTYSTLSFHLQITYSSKSVYYQLDFFCFRALSIQNE